MCVCVFVGSPGDEPRSRTHMLPMELHPQWVCVSRWALSFLTKCKSSTGDGGMERGWVETGPPSVLLKNKDGPCGAWTVASLWNWRVVLCSISLFHLLVLVFSLLFFLFSRSYGSNVPFIPSSSSSKSCPLRVAVFLFLILVLEVQTKLLELGTSPTLCLHC